MLRVPVSSLQFASLSRAFVPISAGRAAGRVLQGDTSGYNIVIDIDADAALGTYGGSASTIAAAITAALNEAAASGALGAELASQPELAADLGVSRELLAATIPTITPAVYVAAASPSPSAAAVAPDSSTLAAVTGPPALSASALGGLIAGLVLAAAIGGAAGCVLVTRRRAHTRRTEAAAAEAEKWEAAHGTARNADIDEKHGEESRTARGAVTIFRSLAPESPAAHSPSAQSSPRSGVPSPRGGLPLPRSPLFALRSAQASPRSTQASPRSAQLSPWDAQSSPRSALPSPWGVQSSLRSAQSSPRAAESSPWGAASLPRSEQPSDALSPSAISIFNVISPSSHVSTNAVDDDAHVHGQGDPRPALQSPSSDHGDDDDSRIAWPLSEPEAVDDLYDDFAPELSLGSDEPRDGTATPPGVAVSIFRARDEGGAVGAAVAAGSARVADGSPATARLQEQDRGIDRSIYFL